MYVHNLDTCADIVLYSDICTCIYTFYLHVFTYIYIYTSYSTSYWYHIHIHETRRHRLSLPQLLTEFILPACLGTLFPSAGASCDWSMAPPSPDSREDEICRAYHLFMTNENGSNLVWSIWMYLISRYLGSLKVQVCLHQPDVFVSALLLDFISETVDSTPP